MRCSRWYGPRRWSRGGSESGQTMAEYATLLGILVIGVVIVIGAFSTGVANKLQSDLVTILSGT
jgi:Flp pilus assembly pilin Flp